MAVEFLSTNEFICDSLADLTQKPNAIHFNVEPYAAGVPFDETIANYYIDFLQALRDKLDQLGNPHGFLLSVSIPFWFETVSLTRGPQTKPLHEWVRKNNSQYI